MKRYEKFVLEAENGITFETSEGTSGELIIRALNIVSNNVYSELPIVSAGEYAEVLSMYIDNDGNKAVVPQGWTVSGVRKENAIFGKNVGLVIYRIPKKIVGSIDWSDSKGIDKLQRIYDQLVWTPVELLDANGTLDGEHFSEKFGRRNYRNVEFSENEFYETLESELALQFESVKKYGGFYISRYNISKKNKEICKPQSVKGESTWTYITFNDAKEVAATLEKSSSTTSHLTFGAEYDSVLEWFIKSNARTFSEIVDDSTNWGNHWKTENSPKKVVKTGSREEWCTNNIYDFAGNVDEWTQEQKGSLCRVTRGGNCGSDDDYCSVAYRKDYYPFNDYSCTGFRATLYIK